MVSVTVKPAKDQQGKELGSPLMIFCMELPRILSFYISPSLKYPIPLAATPPSKLSQAANHYVTQGARDTHSRNALRYYNYQPHTMTLPS